MKRSLIRAALAVVLCVLAVSSTASARSRNWIDVRRGHPNGDWSTVLAAVNSPTPLTTGWGWLPVYLRAVSLRAHAQTFEKSKQLARTANQPIAPTGK